jgi:hypothetical protein
MRSLHSLLPRLAFAALFAAALAVVSMAAAGTLSEFTTHSAQTLSGRGPWYRLILPLAVQMRARHIGPA